MVKKFLVGIVAPSSKVPEIEFALGLERIREAGLEPIVHPQCLASHLFFAGTDQERAQAFYDFAQDERFSVLWAARGGYGAVRILPLLDKLTAKGRIPRRKKLLVGFSDSTALLEYVRVRWGWSVLHAPMPGLRKFCALPDDEWKPLLKMIRGQPTRVSWQKTRLRFVGSSAPPKAIEGELVGGNLSVWTSLVGTPYAGQAKGKILFLEDIDENLYRVDRMVQQLIVSGSFKGVRAVLLGNFLGCRDSVPSVLACMPENAKERDRLIHAAKPENLEPLRATLDAQTALNEIFSEVVRRCKVPVAYGLPVGHGPEKAPLPLGVPYQITPQGRLKTKRGSPPFG